MSVGAGAAESDGRIILSESSDTQLAIWISSKNGEEFDVFYGYSSDEEGYRLLGPIRTAETLRSDENGLVVIMEADDFGPVLLLQNRTQSHNLEVRFKVTNLYEYVPGKLCALSQNPGDKYPHLWFEPLDNNKWGGDIDFGPVDEVFFHEGIGDRSFFYAVDSKNNLLVEKPQLKTSNSIIKAKKIATIQQGTKPVDGGTYLGFWTDKGDPAYTVGGEKPTIFKKYGHDTFYFCEGFMFNDGDNGGLKHYPENPMPVSPDEVDEIFRGGVLDPYAN